MTYRLRETFDEPSLGLTAPRVQHTATKLPNGRVLVAGGWACFLGCPGDEHYTAWDTAEIYDPTTEVSTQTGNMTSPRSDTQRRGVPVGQHQWSENIGTGGAPKAAIMGRRGIPP